MPQLRQPISDLPTANASTVVDEEPNLIKDVSTRVFTITLELRLERLPPRGQYSALLRFFPTTEGRSRRRNLASVYVDHDGVIVDASVVAAAPSGGGDG